MSDDLIPVVALSELQGSPLKSVTCAGREILLCSLNGEIHAVENRCSHADQRLSEGKLKGHRVICPLHGAAFDVRTGEALSKPARDPIETFEVTISGDQVFLKLP